MAGRPAADPTPILRYLAKHGPRSSGQLRQLARDGVLPLTERTVRKIMTLLKEQGLVTQHSPQGDYYPNHDPDTGGRIIVMAVTEEESRIIEAIRSTKQVAQ